MVTVTFLGTGGAFSSGRRTNLALLIEGADFRMLVEAGPMIMQQLAGVNLKAADIDQVFVSHGHGDHVLGFPMLALNRLGSPTPLHVYAGLSTVTTLRILSALSFSSLGAGDSDLRWHQLSEEGPDEASWATGVRLRTAVPDAAPYGGAGPPTGPPHPVRPLGVQGRPLRNVHHRHPSGGRQRRVCPRERPLDP